MWIQPDRKKIKNHCRYDDGWQWPFNTFRSLSFSNLLTLAHTLFEHVNKYVISFFSVRVLFLVSTLFANIFVSSQEKRRRRRVFWHAALNCRRITTLRLEYWSTAAALAWWMKRDREEDKERERKTHSNALVLQSDFWNSVFTLYSKWLHQLRALLAMWTKKPWFHNFYTRTGSL